MFSEKAINIIKCLICVLVIAVPLVYFPTIMMPFQLSKTVVFQILAEIIFALWLGLAIFNKEYRPKFTPITVALIFFIIIVTISAIFGPDWRMGLWSDEQRSLGLVALWHFFALFFVLASLRDKINWQKLWFLSFGSATVVSLIGISQKFIVFPKGSNPWLYILYVGIPERIGSTFSNSSFMAGYLLFNFFIGLWLIKSQISNLKPQIFRDFKFWFLSIGTILLFIAIFLSQTLGAILGLAAGTLLLIIYFAFRGGQVVKKTALGFLIAIFLFSCAFWLARDAGVWQEIPGLKRVANFSLQDASIRGRLITWGVSWEAFKEKPFLGWGFENFRIPFNKYYDPRLLTKDMSGTYWDKPHNILLEYLIMTGIVGFLAYLGIFVAFFWTLFKKQSNCEAQPQIKQLRAESANYKIFFAAIITAYFAQNLFVFDTIGTYLMFFLILAFVNNCSDNELLISSNKPITNITNNSQKFIAAAFLAIILIPIYFNYQIFKGANYEYWGVNYFLNQLEESSLVAFSQAIKVKTPYIDDIRKNFANTIKQAYQQNISYSNLEDLQGKLANHLRLVIKRRPKDFFNYINLAEFKNVFYQYNPDYPKEAEILARKALELSPKRQQVYYTLAKSKLLQGDVKGAYNVFNEIISFNPDSADPHFYFALMAYGLGDFTKGASELAEAERLGRNPQKFEEFINLGNFVGDFDHNYKKAVGYYISALQLFNERAINKTIAREDILLKLAVAYYFDGDFEKSREKFLELKKTIDFKSLPIYPDLQPILQEFEIN